mmetsp:Transcript_76678/g.215170  ORF Transcript_76678/g.215170 Transcript_76678/m.215170 type:complete len:288 (-) Transcript_76678:57-920(-)
MVGNFVAPFSRTLAILVFPMELMDMRVVAFWAPALLGFFVCMIGLLGHLSLKFRRPAVVLPYVILSSAHLVWQSELSKMLRQVARNEDLSDLKALSKEARVSDLHLALFEAPYGHFSTMYTDLQCRAAERSGSSIKPLKLECSMGSFEGKMLQFAVHEFCRAKGFGDAENMREFDRRVEACEVQGREAKIMPQARRPAETFFCRCRAAVYDLIRAVCPFISVAWCAQLLGVWIAMYFAVERNLSRMHYVQRRQVLCFGAVGLVALVCRAILFAEDYFDDEVFDAAMR